MVWIAEGECHFSLCIGNMFCICTCIVYNMNSKRQALLPRHFTEMSQRSQSSSVCSPRRYIGLNANRMEECMDTSHVGHGEIIFLSGFEPRPRSP